jgi:hypothetical protein
MKLNKLWSWAFPSKDINKFKYLQNADIINLGFKETKNEGHIINFKRGNMSLKWDFHVAHRIITIKWGKSMRYFGIVETPRDLDIVLFNIEKYFSNKK